MATFKTYDSVGAKEDVSDVISMLTPHKTPFLTSIGGPETVKQKLYSWQEDELEPGKDNAQVEGFDATEEDCTTTEMLQNTTQIFSRTIKLSGSTTNAPSSALTRRWSWVRTASLAGSPRPRSSSTPTTRSPLPAP
jgi:hypothetical protein